MRRTITSLLLSITVLLLALPTVYAQDQSTTPITLTAEIATVGEDSFTTTDGDTIFVNEETTIRWGWRELTLDDLEPGMTVEIEVTLQEDGTYLALRVKLQEVDEETELEWHPIANALAEFFDVSPEEILALIEEGYGFGEIARAYQIALLTENDPATILEAYASGLGWGEILREYGLHPSRTSLGFIVRHRPHGDEWTPPGQAKKGNDESEWTPPGQAKKGDDESEWIPPGQAKKGDDESEWTPPGHQKKEQKEHHPGGGNRP